MVRRNTLIFFAVLIILALCLLIVLPIQQGILGKKGVRLGLDLQGGVHIVYRADLSSVSPGDQANAINGVIAVLENRINPFGVNEPLIQKQGSDRISVELPGKTFTDKEIESLSRVALLEFGELAADNETAKWENQLGKWKPATAELNGQQVELTSRYFKNNTFVTRDDVGRIVLIFEWDSDGSKLSEVITSRLQPNKPLAIFEGSEALLGEDGLPIAPIVRSTITTRGQIEGLSYAEATRLSQQLNAGRLPVPLQIIYNQTVSPILGAGFLTTVIKAGIAGILVTMLFMIVYYRVPGLMACLALSYYAVLTLAVFKLLGVTLTLAGIGGFVLSVGMAIDANVLIFERIKEELIVGKTLGSAIEAGFSRAWSAIWDSNVTTILAGVILYWLGSSIVASAPVKGFAVTLSIGVAASMFSAITVTRTFLRPFAGTALAHNISLFTPHRGGRNA